MPVSRRLYLLALLLGRRHWPANSQMWRFWFSFVSEASASAVAHMIKGVHVGVFQSFEGLVQAGANVGLEVPDLGPVRLFGDEECVLVRIDQLRGDHLGRQALGLEISGEGLVAQI